MKYELQVKETGNKAAKFIYTVVDENGVVISTRSSNREYVACTIDGQYYFGRLNLIGKGDHGKQLKYCAGYCSIYNPRTRKWDWVMGRWEKPNQMDSRFIPGPGTITTPTPIAYKK